MTPEVAFALWLLTFPAELAVRVLGWFGYRCLP